MLVLIRNSEGKKLLGRSRCRWQDNIKMDIKDVGCEIVDWIQMDWDRVHVCGLTNMVMNLLVP
jgi:hypothetical protein